MTEWLLLAVAVLLIAANAVFVAAEFSFVTVDRATVERHAEAGDPRAQILLRCLASLSTQLSGAQLGITVTSLLVGWLAEPSLAMLLRGPLGLTGLPDGAITGLSLTLALSIATGVQMIFGELVPKNWAIAEPLRVGRAVGKLQRTFTIIAGPLIRVLNGAANRILRAMGIEPVEELASARSPQELTSLVSRSGHAGTLDTATAELVTRSISFGDRTADDVMTPRPRVRFISADQPVGDVLSLTAATGHARFPVIGSNVDEVVGTVHFKHAWAIPTTERDTRRVSDVMVDPVVVPDTMELDPLLAALRLTGLQMAVVVDEYGGTAGIVTLEDLVEEIVGEIADEQDRPTRRLRVLADGSWIVSGLLRPDEVSDEIGLGLPEGEESDTLGGLIVERLGRIPAVGDRIVVTAVGRDADQDGVAMPVPVELTVDRLDGLRIDQVRLRRLDGTPSGEVEAVDPS